MKIQTSPNKPAIANIVNTPPVYASNRTAQQQASTNTQQARVHCHQPFGNLDMGIDFIRSIN